MAHTDTHSLGCLAIEVATENLQDEGRIDTDSILSLEDDRIQDQLIQDTATGYLENNMTTCTCK